ncbi:MULTISPECIES: hypothetical protein [unclassified Streptomyces]|nr:MULTISPECIES: hypothetical protein [unclassified Streptomyces]
MRYLAVAVLIAVPAAVSLRLGALMAFILAALYLLHQLSDNHTDANERD